MAFGKQIKRLREEAGISAQKLAEKLGVDVARYRKWEQNDATPRHEDIDKIESFFGKSIAEIMKLNSIKEFLKVPTKIQKVPHGNTSNNDALSNNALHQANANSNNYLPDLIAALKNHNEFLQRLLETNLIKLSDQQQVLSAQVMAVHEYNAEREVKDQRGKVDPDKVDSRMQHIYNLIVGRLPSHLKIDGIHAESGK